MLLLPVLPGWRVRSEAPTNSLACGACRYSVDIAALAKSQNLAESKSGRGGLGLGERAKLPGTCFHLGAFCADDVPTGPRPGVGVWGLTRTSFLVTKPKGVHARERSLVVEAGLPLLGELQ